MGKRLTEIAYRNPASGSSAPPAQNPIVVFGTGGSGTRAVAAFLSACGVWMGKRVNGSGDAVVFTSLLETHVDSVIGTTHRLDYDVGEIIPLRRRSIVDDYWKAAERHRRGMPSLARWGFKHPRHLFMLPIIDVAFTNAFFVHVVRDGRDMLLSRNRNQPRKYFEELFGRPFAHTDEDVARFWAKSNMEARAFGMRWLKNRYTILRIEDVCGPQRETELLAFANAIGLDPGTAAHCADVFEPQESFGRGRRESTEGTLDEEFDTALAAFRYA